MAVQITYFVHGTTTDNESKLSSGWNDVKLSAVGKHQSKELTAKTSQYNFDTVFTSIYQELMNQRKSRGGINMKLFKTSDCANVITVI